MSSVTKSSSSHSDEEVELRRGPWTVEEDSMLIQYIASHGEGHWNLLAKRSGLRRTGKSCRLRWLNYLKPDVKRGDLTPQEQLLILELHSKLGNRWSKIAQHLPGRTDNEIKNYWRTRVQKQARNLKIDSNSTAFQEVIRCLWIPRLLQKIHGSSPSATTRPLNLEPQVPLNKSTLTYSLELDHQHQKNSSSENCSSPSVDSSLDQSMHISSIPQISEYPTSPFGAMGGYDVDTNSFGMEPFSLTPPMGDFRDPIDDRHLVQSNWINDDMADSLWNMDELWQFRQL